MADSDITALLHRVSEGDDGALAVVVDAVYDALHTLAEAHLRRERSDHTLSPTALVNEVYLKLVDQTRASWESRGHFLAIAATAMRRVLVDHARAKRRQKRSAPAGRIGLTDHVAIEGAGPDERVDFIALDEALDHLAGHDTRKAKVVELRFFGGLTVDETAESMAISPATVKRDWEVARLWLARAMAG